MKTRPATKSLLYFPTQRPEHWIDDDRALASSRQLETTWQRKGSMRNIIIRNVCKKSKRINERINVCCVQIRVVLHYSILVM